MMEFNPAHSGVYALMAYNHLGLKAALNKIIEFEKLKVEIYLVTGFPVCVAQRVTDQYWDIHIGNTQYVGSGDLNVILEQLMKLLAMTGA